MNPQKSHVEILHDHYKDSFFHIREREKQRDRLFIVLIALIGFLFIVVRYPDSLRLIFGDINALGTKLNLGELPVAAILSATWTFLLALTVRYCQSSINVERQYSYLHGLELKISSALGDPDAYCREGKAYLDNYPVFSGWTWLFYTSMFPAIVIATTGLLMHTELTKLQVPTYHKWYDAMMGVGIVLSMLLYRVWHLIKALMRKLGFFQVSS